MTVNTTLWAMHQDDLLPLPKLLLIFLTDHSGMSRTYDVSLEKYARHCCASIVDVAEAIDFLDGAGKLQVDGTVETAQETWRVTLGYPPQDFEMSWPKRDREPKKVRPGWLYILGTDHDITKVGITGDLPARVNSLDINAALETRLAWSFACPMDVARKLERTILSHFEAHRFKGEWLKLPSQTVVDHAKALAADKSRDGP